MQVQTGAGALQRALHDLLRFPENAQSSAFQGFVVLSAKVKVESGPKQVRPIVLTEALTTLGARIATATWWPIGQTNQK